MNVAQLRKVLAEAGRQKEQAGEVAASHALAEFEKLLKSHDKKSVVKVAELIKSSVK
ncbi:MAG: hypothetical protein KJ587_16050 [Alphaproteobacteria bacterium]|nr:hypothetical protein [Alphaproteobacteria bacterium]